MDVRALLFASGSERGPFVLLSPHGQESFNSSGFDPLVLSAWLRELMASQREVRGGWSREGRE